MLYPTTFFSHFSDSTFEWLSLFYFLFFVILRICAVVQIISLQCIYGMGREYTHLMCARLSYPTVFGIKSTLPSSSYPIWYVIHISCLLFTTFTAQFVLISFSFFFTCLLNYRYWVGRIRTNVSYDRRCLWCLGQNLYFILHLSVALFPFCCFIYLFIICLFYNGFWGSIITLAILFISTIEW